MGRALAALSSSFSLSSLSLRTVSHVGQDVLFFFEGGGGSVGRTGIPRAGKYPFRFHKGGGEGRRLPSQGTSMSRFMMIIYFVHNICRATVPRWRSSPWLIPAGASVSDE